VRGRVHKTPSQPTKPGCGACACNPSYIRSIRRRITDQVGQGINMRPYSKNNYRKRAGSIGQVVEYLPSKCKALSLTSSTAKQNKNQKKPLVN
jgi:hypothetical protein